VIVDDQLLQAVVIHERLEITALLTRCSSNRNSAHFCTELHRIGIPTDTKTGTNNHVRRMVRRISVVSSNVRSSALKFEFPAPNIAA
jgi:hypothetical protein